MRVERAGLAGFRIDARVSPGHGRTVELRLVFPAGQSNVRAALASVMSGLGAMDLAEDDSSTVELVLAEVLNNVAEHAYLDDGVGMIELFLTQTGQGLNCRVLDSGQAMPANALPRGYPPSPAGRQELLPEGGFGWFLIRKLTRDLTYLRRDDRNILSFRIEVGLPVRTN